MLGFFNGHDDLYVLEDTFFDSLPNKHESLSPIFEQPMIEIETKDDSTEINAQIGTPT